MSNIDKSRIKEEAFNRLEELAMNDVYSRYNITSIDKCTFKPEYVITVSKSNYKSFLDMMIDYGITFFHTNKFGETQIAIFIFDKDIYKLANEKIKRLHDCIEDL